MAGVVNSITVRDMRFLLKNFKKLKAMATARLPDKDCRLWAQAMAEARTELVEKLKVRAQAITYRPSQQRQSSQETSENLQMKIEKTVEVNAEHKYLRLDPRYASDLEERARKAEAVLKQIDHYSTPIRSELVAFSEANGTLLAADWKELRQELTIQGIMRLNEHELFERTIGSIEAIIRRKSRTRWSRVTCWIPNFVTVLYEKTLKVSLEHFYKDR